MRQQERPQDSGGLTANDAHQGAPCAARYGLRTRNTMEITP